MLLCRLDGGLHAADTPGKDYSEQDRAFDGLHPRRINSLINEEAKRL